MDDHEALRQANILKNRELLKSLGLDEFRIPNAPAKRPSTSTKKKSAPKRKAENSAENGQPAVKKAKKSSTISVADTNAVEASSAENGSMRRSSRRAGKPRVNYANDGEDIKRGSLTSGTSSNGRRADVSEDYTEDDEEEDEEEDGQRIKQRNNPKMGKRTHDPKTYGPIPNVPVGTVFATRMQASAAAIHAPPVSGIHGSDQGAYSIALSGGYDDDVDMGEGFTYTGAGGRNLKGTKQNPKNLRTAPQSSDQTFEQRDNKALLQSVETKNPIRVIRGFKLQSKYAPKEGYRYDGLYTVEKAWIERGLNPGGFKVCKYALKRLPGQPPLMESQLESSENEESENEGEDQKQDGNEASEEINEEKVENAKEEEVKKDVEYEDAKEKDVEEEETGEN